MTTPLSLYVHLPWCVSKCPYCDFNSHSMPKDPPRRRYVKALISDLESEAQRANGREIQSIFFGGGTPSLFTPGEIGTILDAASATLSVARDCEVSLEANPGTVERGDPVGFRKAGVNRLSLGAQSFNATMLQALGRIHGPDEIDLAYKAARTAGFDNINIDLMFALPGQDLSMALDDVQKICALRP